MPCPHYCPPVARRARTPTPRAAPPREREPGPGARGSPPPPLATLLQIPAVSLDLLQQLLEPFALRGDRGNDGRRPGQLRTHVEHRLDLLDRLAGPDHVGLVDDERVRDLHDPRLDHLHPVAQ